MTGGHSLGGASDHNKAHGLSLFPHQRKLCIEGLLGRHALGMLGRTLNGNYNNIMEDGDSSYPNYTKVTTFTFANFLSIIIIIHAKLLLWVHTCRHACMKLSFHVFVSFPILNLMPKLDSKQNKQEQ